jgi:hypothetical protein
MNENCLILFIPFILNYMHSIELNLAKSYEDLCSCPFSPIVLPYLIFVYRLHPPPVLTIVRNNLRI